MAKKVDQVPEPSSAPPTGATITLPHLPRAGSIAITAIETTGETIDVTVAYREVTAAGDREAKRRLAIPVSGLPTGPVDAIEAALMDAIRGQLVPAKEAPAAEASPLDSALVRLTERRVIALA